MIGKLAWRRGVMSIVERATVGALRKTHQSTFVALKISLKFHGSVVEIK